MPKKIYIVNPTGTIHDVTKAHAAMRLKQPGWRLATSAEVSALKKNKGLQTLKNRSAKPWRPMVEDEGEVDLEVDESQKPDK